MKKKNQNENLIKALLAVLSVIAVCMVIVVVMVVSDHVGGLEQAEEISQTIETETPEEMVEREAEASEIEEEDENPYYQYEGELSETPITPTEIENDEIIDDFMVHYQQPDDVQDRIRETIMEEAKKLEVYANPTVIPGCEVRYSNNSILIDLHTKDNVIMTLCYQVVEDEFVIRYSYFQTKNQETAPVKKYGLYILNEGVLSSYLEYYGFNEDETRTVQTKLIDAVYEDLQKNNPEIIDKIKYLYITGWMFAEDGKDTSDFDCSVEFSLKDENIKGAIYFWNIDLRNDEKYPCGTSYDGFDE